MQTFQPNYSGDGRLSGDSSQPALDFELIRRELARGRTHPDVDPTPDGMWAWLGCLRTNDLVRYAWSFSVMARLLETPDLRREYQVRLDLVRRRLHQRELHTPSGESPELLSLDDALARLFAVGSEAGVWPLGLLRDIDRLLLDNPEAKDEATLPEMPLVQLRLWPEGGHQA